MVSPQSISVRSGGTTSTVLSTVGHGQSAEEAVPTSSTGLHKALLVEVTEFQCEKKCTHVRKAVDRTICSEVGWAVAEL